MPNFDRWRVNFNDASGNSVTRQVPNPPGFSVHGAKEGSSGSLTTTKRKEIDLQKRQQSRAIAPWKQVATLCFMMFMTSNTIQIFSLLTTFSGIATSLQAIMTSGDSTIDLTSRDSYCEAAFKPDVEGKLDTLTPRILFCLIHMGGVIFGLYKLNAIGLLPTHASDWFSTMQAPSAMEYATGGLKMM